MNILYLCDEYPPGQHGGIGTSVQLLARQMAVMGHRVIVAGLYPLGYGGADEFTDESVKVYRFRLDLDAPWFENRDRLLVRIVRRLLKVTGMLERDIRKSLTRYHSLLEELIARYQIDIVEMPDYNDYVKFCRGYVPFPKLSVPVVVKLNGSLTYFACEADKDVAVNIKQMEQTILKQATAISSASKYTAQKSAEYFGYDKPIEVIHNGINTHVSAGDVARDPHQVIFTGSLMAKKGIYQLAKAWNMVNAGRPDARLLILGKGNQHKVTEYLTPSARRTVTFTGHVDTQTLYRYLSASAISIFPSYAEAFALAPLEAMVCGTAVINSNRTSGAELIDDQVDGILIDPDDIVQMAAAMVYLLTDTHECERLAAAGKSKAEHHFSIENIAGENLGFYSRVLSGMYNGL
ncbi:hypothetical protein BEL04_23315 [Mucilaginibacter sp. PPCGB 2223]|uniref:glycosyltransferase family 4 protein n=1 Tax=Mucilaginibacter sp. PPCGB 2223 TaxID=1886027 RepID=UPI000825AB3E|nr:glycosyltransferase family 4 protein [Mucilaginibacter sp. PPCGB 2223]OCX50242.1 hypothetical protein BEL04_23315 [Mucilaginibacter sp. PPCGB 2223]